MTIWVNTLVQNEERYIWYSVMSVINHVEKILIWDTGSTDKTVEIINEIKRRYPSKIEFREVGKVDINEFTKIRQEMLNETKSNWLMILDGDEVWWEDSIKRVMETVSSKSDIESIISPYYNIVGDIYHFQEEAAGNYMIDDKKGHYNIRLINRNIPGLHLEKPHGKQGFFDERGKLIQDRSRDKRRFLNLPYLHFTNMIRSNSIINDLEVPKRNIKYKYEIGESFPLDFYYPEVFFVVRPNIVPSPWEKMNKDYYSKSAIQTPLRKIKRRLMKRKSGY